MVVHGERLVMISHRSRHLGGSHCLKHSISEVRICFIFIFFQFSYNQINGGKILISFSLIFLSYQIIKKNHFIFPCSPSIFFPLKFFLKPNEGYLSWSSRRVYPPHSSINSRTFAFLPSYHHCLFLFLYFQHSSARFTQPSFNEEPLLSLHHLTYSRLSLTQFVLPGCHNIVYDFIPGSKLLFYFLYIFSA